MSNRFFIIAPMFNASKTLARMLHSIVGQSYDNWKLLLIDDVSSSEHCSLQEKLLSKFQGLVEDNDKIQVIWNDYKKWEVENVLQGLNACKEDDIVVRVDPDDFITDLDAFRIIDDVYKHTNCETLWTSHRWHDDDRISTHNISRELPAGVDPYSYPWVSSHMKTFRKYLLDGVNETNFKDTNGEFFKRIGDQTFMLPALKRSKVNIHLPLVMYSYRCEMKPSTFQTADAKLQRDEAIFLRQRGFVD